MSKISRNDSNSKDKYYIEDALPNRNYSKLLLRLVLIVVLLVAAFPLLYEIKTKAGIDIVRGIHTGSFLEKHSGGLIKCQWLYPYHCPSDRMT